MLVLPEQYYQYLNIEVQIIDVNDNAPKFPQGDLVFDFEENSRKPISLDSFMAFDVDLGKQLRRRRFEVDEEAAG